MSEPAKTKRILVADADGLSRELLAFYLRDRGNEVTTVGRSAEAWKAMLRQPPDLLVLDVVLPEEGGLRLLTRMRLCEPLASVPVLVVTAIQHKQMIVAMAKRGVASYLLKPDLTLEKLGGALDLIFRDRRPKADPRAAQAEVDEVLHAERAGPAAAPAESAPPAPAAGPTPAEAAAELRKHKPLVTRAQVHELLDRCGDLRAMAPAVAEVVELTGREDCEVRDVVAAIGRDPGMCVKLLTLANARLEDRGEAVQTVATAVTRLGLKAVRQAVINLGVIDGFSEVSDTHLDAAHFWEHGLATGLIAAAATRALGEDEEAIDASFTAGLLHDTGRMVYADLLPDEYGRVLDAAERLGVAVEDVEARLLLVGHAEATDRVFRRWNLPRHLIDPIVFHHHTPAEINRAVPKNAQPCNVVALASALAHALALGHSGNPTLYPLRKRLKAVGLGEGFVLEAARTTPAAVRDLAGVLLDRCRRGVGDYCDRLRDQFEGDPRPLLVGRQIAAHPVALCLGRLLGPMDQPPPTETPPSDETQTDPANLAVVFISHKRQADAAAKRLREAERTAGVEGLPALVVAGSAALLPAPAALGRRPRRDFVLPGRQPDLVQRINELTAPAA
ncbi:MAG: HDOD domain-containing protein [Planctomycetota bacterium]